MILLTLCGLIFIFRITQYILHIPNKLFTLLKLKKRLLLSMTSKRLNLLLHLLYVSIGKIEHAQFWPIIFISTTEVSQDSFKPFFKISFKISGAKGNGKDVISPGKTSENGQYQWHLQNHWWGLVISEIHLVISDIHLVTRGLNISNGIFFPQVTPWESYKDT